MPKWLVRLKGEGFDLEDFPELFCLSKAKVIKEGGSFYLESSEFNPLTSAKEVRERGRVLIKLINVVTNFNRDKFPGISEDAIIRVEDDGKWHGYLFLESRVTIRTKTRGKLTVIAADGSEKVATQPSAHESLFEVAQKYSVVFDALSFYQDGTWDSLYKALETIENDVGGKIIKDDWVAKSDIDLFTQTAQLYRHASSKKYKPPSKPMTLSKARILIKTILSQWISSKK